MSSGSVYSFCFSLTWPFFPLEPFPEECLGRVTPAPRVTGAKSSFAVSLRSFSAGDKKSSLNASFLSRFGLKAAAASVISAAWMVLCQPRQHSCREKIRTSPYSLA
jgi:hypothetical protein